MKKCELTMRNFKGEKRRN